GLPLVAGSLGAMLASAALFGSAMFSIPSAVGVLVRRQLPAAAWGAGMAVFTIVFASGQVAGPVVTGWLADVYGSLRPGLALSVLVVLLGGAVALAQRAPERLTDGASPTREARGVETSPD
ncbi:MAG: YbfB/YjiJ family MFS transporter, partial [Gammaproteobacteria bacterium]